MTVPAAAPAADAGVKVGEPNAAGEAPIRFPVLVLEGQETSDGRYLEAGSLSPRAFPISLLAVAESPHGGQDSAAAVIVGRITSARRVPGSEVTSKRTGQPFPDDSFVWVAEGVIDTTAEVPVGNTSKNAYDLVRSGQLRGVSVDLAGMDYDVVDETTFDANNPRRQLIVHAAEIAAATMVPIPAFADAYGELPDDDAAFAPATDEALAASGAPAWRSAEVGDYPTSRLALMAAGDQGMPVRIPPDSVEQLTSVIDSGEERDATQLAEAVVEHIAMNWALTEPVGEDELPEGGEESMTARPGTLADEEPAEPVADEGDLDEEGDPAEPQACIYGTGDDDHPATHSLLYQDGEQFVSVCDADDQRARDELEKAGETVSSEVAIDGAEPAVTEQEAVVATGIPDAAQWCNVNAGHGAAAAFSLLYDGMTQYLAVCPEHRGFGQTTIEEAGYAVDRVVSIPTAARA